jgi:hypothetical protein
VKTNFDRRNNLLEVGETRRVAFDIVNNNNADKEHFDILEREPIPRSLVEYKN